MSIFRKKTERVELITRVRKMGRGYLEQGSIRQQLYKAYILVGLIPITIIGIFLLLNTYTMFKKYNQDLLESYNQRVSTTFFEITTQTYNIAGKLSYDPQLWGILSRDYKTEDAEHAAIDNISVVDDYNYDYTAIDSVEIYSDNPGIHNYQQFCYAGSDITGQDWFQKAQTQQSAFWQGISKTDTYGTRYWNICLIQKIPLEDSNYHAVLVIRLSGNYLKTRLKENQYQVAVAVGKEEISFSSDTELYGTQLKELQPMDYNDKYYKYAGSSHSIWGKDMVYGSTLLPYRSDSRIYICTLNRNIYSRIHGLILGCVLILLIALLLPIMVIHFFTEYFSGRIVALRAAMHKVSSKDYDIPPSLNGNDEISEAFSDLVVTVSQIQKQNAQMYESQLAEKELMNRQQEMEFKVLASQINPHFLYNTLETIRMKAFTAGDREVAGAIKTLGKIMRYVLDNTGTRLATLEGGLDYIRNYLSIQQLRFGDRISYEIQVQEEIDTGKTAMIPLLMQPLIENAILHGLEEKEAGGMVRISITKEKLLADPASDYALMISISDNGCGMDEQELAELKQHMEHASKDKRSIGLYNVNQRIHLSYGAPYEMRIISQKGIGTAITLVLPYISITEAEENDGKF